MISSWTSRFGDLGVINLRRVRLLSRAKAVAFVILRVKKEGANRRVFPVLGKENGSKRWDLENNTWLSFFQKGGPPHCQTWALRFFLLIISTLLPTCVHFLHLTSFSIPPENVQVFHQFTSTQLLKLLDARLTSDKSLKRLTKESRMLPSGNVLVHCPLWSSFLILQT